jgi:dCMP deaminase
VTNDKFSRYLTVASAISEMSKDPSTKVGAIAIGKGGEFVASGWNGAPRGCDADVPGDNRGERPEKYFWFSHAELNTITNAARVGVPLAGCTLVVTHFPCMDCARAIVQAGITRVVTQLPSGEFLERWREHVARAMRLFDECGVEVQLVHV